MRWATAVMTRMLCSTTRSVRPPRCRSRTSCTSPGMLRWSTPPVTSSRRSTHGARPGERAHHHVVADGESRERPQLLERARDTPAAHVVGGEAREGASVESHHARIGVIEAADDLEERRLAGPVRADDADQLACLHLEGDVAVRRDAAE